MHAPKSRRPSRRARSRNARRRRLLGEHHVVEAGVRRGQRRELVARLVGAPVEAARIDQHAADDDAVAGEELGRRVVDEVGAELERPHQPRRGEGRVDQQRQAVLVRERRDARNVEHVEARVAERLAEQQPRLRADRGAPSVEVARVDERRVDAEARQRVVEQVVRAAVERRATRRCASPRRISVAIARCSAAWPLAVAIAPTPPSSAAMRSSSTAHGRIRDPRIDVARALHVEERRGVLGVGEDERGGLVDRHRARAGRRVGRRAGVQRQRVEAMRLRLGRHGPPGSSTMLESRTYVPAGAKRISCIYFAAGAIASD